MLIPSVPKMRFWRTVRNPVSTLSFQSAFSADIQETAFFRTAYVNGTTGSDCRRTLVPEYRPETLSHFPAEPEARLPRTLGLETTIVPLNGSVRMKSPGSESVIVAAGGALPVRGEAGFTTRRGGGGAGPR